MRNKRQQSVYHGIFGSFNANDTEEESEYNAIAGSAGNTNNDKGSMRRRVGCERFSRYNPKIMRSSIAMSKLVHIC